MGLYGESRNPFAVTKANDFDDGDILRFWVDTPRAGRARGDFVRPTSPGPIYVLGGKGSGKTHLLRYHSYQLQRLRFCRGGFSAMEGVRNDGYVGIYLLCGGLNTGRFSGKGQPPGVWDELFAYYVELWLAKHLIGTVRDIVSEDTIDEAGLTADIVGLFDDPPRQLVGSLGELDDLLSQLRKNLDYQVNNCVFTGELDVRIAATRGRLVFGIPRLVSAASDGFADVLFVYIIDELENLSESQQVLINSLVRARGLPATFRIGVRRFGVKTHRTDASREHNLPDSEFEQVVLDDEFRRSKAKYREFSRQLLSKRVFPTGISGPQSGRDIDLAFETEDERWNSSLFLEIVRGGPASERRHFRYLRDQLLRVGVSYPDHIVEILSVPEYPLLEKVNILLFFGAFRGPDAADAEAGTIAKECSEFLLADGRVGARNIVKRALGHYQSDLVAQLRRENRARQLYLGLDTFFAMSGGVPRALLTTLRNIFDWALYNGEEPLSPHGISIDAQYRGVIRASDWFFDYNVRTAGSDGLLIESAVDRLAQLFRTNRFSDRPVECSLNSFSIAEHLLDAESRRVLRLCENRSLLNWVGGGQKHRNTKRVEMKFQLHPMLCPRWQLPLARRGVIPLTPETGDMIFHVERGRDFDRFLSGFRVSRTFGSVRVPGQPTLF